MPEMIVRMYKKRDKEIMSGINYPKTTEILLNNHNYIVH